MSSPIDLESFLAESHSARLIHEFVSGREQSARISAAAGKSKSAIQFFALWLYAISKGVGSAEELAWRCRYSVGFRWLCAGLGADAKLLAAFRALAPQAIDELLAESLTAIRALGLPPDLAPAAREAQLLALFDQAERQVAELRQQLAEPLGERARRRMAVADLRRNARASRVSAARAELQRLDGARQALATRQAEARRQELERRRAARAPAAAPVRRPTGPRRFSTASSLAWDGSDDTEGFFRKALAGCLAFFVAVSVALMLIKPPPVERAKDEKIPQRLTKLFEEQKEKPKLEKPKEPEIVKPTIKDLKPEETAAETPVEAKSEAKVVASKEIKATPEQVAAARARASQTGLAAMKDQFAALRSLGSDTFRQDQVSVGSGGGVGGGTGSGNVPGSGPVQRDLIGSIAGSGSGGVSGRAIAYAGGGSLAGRATTQVRGAAGSGAPSLAQVEKEAKASKRSGEDIRLAFDTHKSAIYSIYRRALRQNPLLEGRVVLKLTIDKSGRVTACSIVSSALNDPDLEEKIVARVSTIDFGARPNGETWTGTYQIDFVPSS